MENFKEVKKQADALRKEQEFEEALDLYNQLIDAAEQPDKWLYWSKALCLRSLKDFDGALEAAEISVELDPNFEYGKNQLAWCIFYTSIGRINQDMPIEEILHNLKRIASYCKPEDSFSAYNKSFIESADKLNQRTPKPVEEIEWILSQVNPENLDNEGFTTADSRGKPVTLASQKEKYYLVKAFMLFEKQEYEALATLIEEAFATVAQFNNGTDAWLERLVAKSKVIEGDFVKAESLYYSLLKKKKDWYLLAEMAEIQLKLDKKDKALQTIVRCFEDKAKVETKAGVLPLGAAIFQANEMPQEAYLHVKMALLFKRDQEQPVPESLQELGVKYGVKIAEGEEAWKTERYLKRAWELEREKLYPPTRGFIKKLLPGNVAGFVEADDKVSYFFSAKDIAMKPEKLIEGARIKFYLKDGFDKKKNVPVKNAVKIKLSE